VGDFTVETSGGAIVGWRTGSGPAALVLHGGPGLTDFTQGLAGELDGWESIGYQQRGVEPTTVEGPYTVEANVADALAVLDGLGIDRAWIVGHSWGGHLAMHVAVAAPGRVLGLVAIDPLGAVPDGGEADLEAGLTARLPDDVAALVNELDERLLRGEGGEAEGMEMLRVVWPYYFARPDEAPPMPETRMNVDVYADTWASIRDHFGRGTLVSGLPLLDRPALFVAGRESPMPSARSEESAALVPGARVEIVEGSGHFPWLERPGSVRAAVAKLLAAA
jgi:pimeloyl-ACP methyl ester carboxylesterase